VRELLAMKVVVGGCGDGGSGGFGVGDGGGVVLWCWW
jgi:hypothetical protein